MFVKQFKDKFKYFVFRILCRLFGWEFVLWNLHAHGVGLDLYEPKGLIAEVAYLDIGLKPSIHKPGSLVRRTGLFEKSKDGDSLVKECNV